MKAYAPVFTLYIIYFLDVFGLAVAFPLFTALLTDPSFGGVLSFVPLQYRFLFAPLMIASFPLMQLLCWPLFMHLGISQGRKYTFNLSLFFLGLSFGLTALAIAVKSFIFLFLTRLISGACAGNFILCIVPPAANESRWVHFFHKKFFQIGATGLVLGILTGGILSDIKLSPSFHSYTPFVFTAFFSLVILCITTYSLTSDPSLDPWWQKIELLSWKSFRKVVFKKKRIISFLIFFLFQMTWLSNLQYFSVYIWKIFGPERMFITFMLMGMTIACLVGLYIVHPSLYRLLGRKILLQFSLAGALLLHFLSIVTTNLFVTSLFHILFSLYVGLIWSCVGLYITSSSLRLEYELVAYKIVTFLMSAVAAALIAGFLAVINIHLIYLFGCICLLLALIFSFMIEN